MHSRVCCLVIAGHVQSTLLTVDTKTWSFFFYLLLSESFEFGVWHLNNFPGLCCTVRTSYLKKEDYKNLFSLVSDSQEILQIVFNQYQGPKGSDHVNVKFFRWKEKQWLCVRFVHSVYFHLWRYPYNLNAGSVFRIRSSGCKCLDTDDDVEWAAQSDGAISGSYLAQYALYNVQCDGQKDIRASAAGQVPVSA